MTIALMAPGIAAALEADESAPMTFAVEPSPAASPPVIPERLTLAQSVEQALKTSPGISAYYYRTLSAATGVGIAATQMLPTATLSAGRSYVRNDSYSGFIDPDYADQHTDTLSVQISQPLFAGMTLFNNYQKAQLNEELAKAELQGVTDQVVLDVQLFYYNLMKAKGEVQTLRGAEKSLLSSADAVRAYEKARMAPYVDVLQVEMDLADTQQRLLKAENEVATLGINLNALLGLPPEVEVDYVGDLGEGLPELPLTLQECLDRAKSQRPDLLIRRKALALAEKEAEIVYGRFFPQIDVQGGYVSRDVTYDSTVGVGAVDRDYRTDYWTAGVNLQWRFFESGRTKLEYQRVLHQVASLREDLRDVEIRASAQVRTALLGVGEARQRIGLAEKILREAVEGQARSKVRFEARVGTVVELLDAQARLTRAETNRLQALADFRLALAQLSHAMGEKNPVTQF